MPTAKRVIEYWAEKLDVEPRRCFACGDIRKLHRAHIVPVCRGGTHELQNIHLLCPSCHDESEDIKCYDEWFAYKRSREYKLPLEHQMLKWKKYGWDVEKAWNKLKKLYDGIEFFEKLEEWQKEAESRIYYGRE